MGSTIGRMLRRAFFPQKQPTYNITLPPPQEEKQDNFLPYVVIGGLGLLLLTQMPKRKGRR
jgi:hypothetical protein